MIVDKKDNVVSTGFSRELPAGAEGEIHAEHAAMTKLGSRSLQGYSIYTTMEPCSVRTSGKRPCADRIIEAGLKEVYVGVLEPSDFVVCEGTQKLLDASIAVTLVEGLQEECVKVARGQSI